jgi:uncharacterized protein (DUF433 family)
MTERIEINPKVQHGKPVIKGTRVPVARILAAIGGGMAFDEIEREYLVSEQDIRAAVAFAGELVDEQGFYASTPRGSL